MRYIAKQAGTEAEACIQGFVDVQMRERAAGQTWEVLRLDYRSFTRTGQLCGLLVQEQKGLCAYTGVGLDGRLVDRAPQVEGHSFRAHIEHLKPQAQCRAELEAGGGVVGRDLGEDMAYRNLVAAVEVSGALEEQFGAAYRGARPLPILPTDPACSDSFDYLESGEILGTNGDARTTVENLRLDHRTLNDWRRGAIRGLLPEGAHTPRTELEQLVQLLEDDARPTLPEFSFVVAQIARDFLAMQQGGV